MIRDTYGKGRRRTVCHESKKVGWVNRERGERINRVLLCAHGERVSLLLTTAVIISRTLAEGNLDGQLQRFVRGELVIK